MTVNLAGSLGLDQVEGDPNKMPDGKYDGHVLRSEYVLVKGKDEVAHVITYQVDDGDQRGKQGNQWFTLGKSPRNAEDQFPEKADEIVKFTPTMIESQKPWYKKAFMDLGVPEAEVGTTAPHLLQGIKVTFGMKTKNGYQNVNFVEKRVPAAIPGLGADGVATVGGTAAPEPQPQPQDLGGLV